MKKICVFTGTRAEYGILTPLINKIKHACDLELQIVALGAHLSPEYGYTYQEIENDGFEISGKIECLLSSDTDVGICKTMGLIQISCSEMLDRLKPDLIVILGDRYEMIPIGSTAVVMNIPIAHIHGGEITEGAIDDSFRHAITKMSTLHFVATETYRKRVIQLGENPDSVYNFGALGVENIRNLEYMSIEQLKQSLEFNTNKKIALVTFHPVTLCIHDMERQIDALMAALDACEDLFVIFTKANADNSGRMINQRIDDYVLNHLENAKAYFSLGRVRYLNLMRYASIVIGNSSSGIIEAPVYKIPVVNIGDRQDGRIKSKNIIDTRPIQQEIYQAIQYGLSNEFMKAVSESKNEYGDGNTSEKIIEVLTEYLLNNSGALKKQFYDINF